MLHEIEDLEIEGSRVSHRPEADSAPPVLAYFEIAVDGDPGRYASRLRGALDAVLKIAVSESFDDDDLPVDTVPAWFSGVCRGGGSPEPFAAEGRDRYVERTGGAPWNLQNWLSRFDPDLEVRGWAWWDMTSSPAGRACCGSGRTPGARPSSPGRTCGGSPTRPARGRWRTRCWSSPRSGRRRSPYDRCGQRGPCLVRRRDHHRLSGISGRDRRSGFEGGHLRGSIQARPDDVDQTVVPVDDVSLWMGNEGRTGTCPRDRHHPRGIRMVPFPFLPQPFRPDAIRDQGGMAGGSPVQPGPCAVGSRAGPGPEPPAPPCDPDRPVGHRRGPVRGGLDR